MPKHQEKEKTVAGLVPAALGGRYELVHLGRDEVFWDFIIRLGNCPFKKSSLRTNVIKTFLDRQAHRGRRCVLTTLKLVNNGHYVSFIGPVLRVFKFPKPYINYTRKAAGLRCIKYCLNAFRSHFAKLSFRYGFLPVFRHVIILSNVWGFGRPGNPRFINSTIFAIRQYSTKEVTNQAPEERRSGHQVFLQRPRCRRACPRSTWTSSSKYSLTFNNVC